MKNCNSYLSKVFPLQYHSYPPIEWQKIIISTLEKAQNNFNLMERGTHLKQETKKMRHFNVHILTIWLEKEWKLLRKWFVTLKSSVYLASLFFANLFYYLAYFCYYSWVPLQFFVLFINPTILFQLTFTFIYSTFSKKFSVSAK